jgi:hypothetical protein
MPALYEAKAYIYEGQAYCPVCADYDPSDPEWSVLFEEDFDESHYGFCCGTCNHSLACVNHIHDQPCPECDG